VNSISVDYIVDKFSFHLTSAVKYSWSIRPAGPMARKSSDRLLSAAWPGSCSSCSQMGPVGGIISCIQSDWIVTARWRDCWCHLTVDKLLYVHKTASNSNCKHLWLLYELQSHVDRIHQTIRQSSSCHWATYSVMQNADAVLKTYDDKMASAQNKNNLII